MRTQKALVAALDQPLEVLKVDGGVTANALCLQLQADILGVEVSRPEVIETTALGPGYAAGPFAGVWGTREELRQHWREFRRWAPLIDHAECQRRYARGQAAVERSLGRVGSTTPNP